MQWRTHAQTLPSIDRIYNFRLTLVEHVFFLPVTAGLYSVKSKMAAEEIVVKAAARVQGPIVSNTNLVLPWWSVSPSHLVYACPR